MYRHFNHKISWYIIRSGNNWGYSCFHALLLRPMYSSSGETVQNKHFFNTCYASWMMHAIPTKYFLRAVMSNVSSASQWLLSGAICDQNIRSCGGHSHSIFDLHVPPGLIQYSGGSHVQCPVDKKGKPILRIHVYACENSWPDQNARGTI